MRAGSAVFRTFCLFSYFYLYLPERRLVIGYVYKKRLRLPLLPVLPTQEMPRCPVLLPGRYDVCRVAESLELFEYAPGVRDTNNLGAWWLENKLDCSLPYEIDEFFDYAGYGESIVENNDGEFVEGLGFVCMEEGYTLENVLQDTDQDMGVI